MNLLKSLKNRKGAIGAVGAVSAGLIILALAFLVVSASYMVPVLAQHDSIVTITPNIANCDELGDTFTVNVENSGSSLDDIFEVRIYDESYVETYGILEFYCGPAPTGWTLYDFTNEYGYCEYKTPQYGTYVIEPGEKVDFSFDAVMWDEECYSRFLVSTLDNKQPQGEHEYHTPQVDIDCSAPIIEKDVGEPKIIGDSFDYWVRQDTLISLSASDNTDECDLGLDYCKYRITVDGVPKEWIDVLDGETLGWEFYFTEDSNHYLEVECYDVAGNKAVLTELDKVDGTPPVTTKQFNGPQKIDPVTGVEWIDGVTTVTLFPTDPEAITTPPGVDCSIGVDKTWYKDFLAPSEDWCRYPERYCTADGVKYCNNCVDGAYPKECMDTVQEDCEDLKSDPCIDKCKSLCIEDPEDPELCFEKCVNEKCTYKNWYECVQKESNERCCGGWDWTLYTGSPIPKNEESCHVLYYFSVDDLGNLEPINANCFFVDKTPPEIDKNVGDPKVDASGVKFSTSGTGTAGWSSEQAYNGIFSAKMTTPTSSDQGRATLPFSGLLGDITSFSYWSYDVNAGTEGQLSIWPSFYLDDNDDGIWDYYLQCEPYYTYGNPTLNTWENYDIMNMKCVAYEYAGDCPHDSPTLAQYINGDATSMECPGHPEWGKFASQEYGSLKIIKIDMRAGYGGPWPGFVGYIDDVTINGDKVLSEPSWWVTQNTPITLKCQDIGPHPSDDVTIYWSYTVDGGLPVTGSHKGESYDLYFPQDSVHVLEFWCKDAVEKESIHDIETFKVDTLPPTIEKTMIGDDHLGDCPPGAIPTEPCFVADNGKNGVHIAVQDHGDICAVDQTTCNYELWWKTELDTCINEFDGTHLYNSDTGQCFVEGGEFGDDGKDIIFTQDSEHILKINCKDALDNAMLEDVETFLVDSIPPKTTKTYGEPFKVEPNCEEWCDEIYEGPYTYEECIHYYCTWWITSDTEITLTTYDEKVGQEYDSTIYWRNLWFPKNDEICYKRVDGIIEDGLSYCHPEYYSGKDYETDGWHEYDGPFKKPEESCHVIEYYAVDALGNEEELKWQCVFVDNTPPKGIKEVGNPNVPIDSDGGDCGTITGDLDVLFLFDLTGSMGGVISSAKTNAVDIMDDIQALVPGAQFGTGSFRDYPSYYDYCGYSDTYGGDGEAPWSLDEDITSDTSAVSAAINTYYAAGGWDGPESYARALYESQFADWRTGATKVVIIFEDSVPHDCDLDSYVDTDCYYDFSTGTDPGRNAIEGDGDDITWAQAVADLKAAGVSVIVVDSSDPYDEYEYSCPDVWKYASGETGGLYTTLGSDFTKTIVDSVTEVVGCNKDFWVRDHVTPITLDCADPKPHPVDQETMCYKISNVDGTDPVWLTEQYCNEFEQGGEYNSKTGECCVYVGDKSYTFDFMEDSNHILEFYCKDHLGNTGETHTELFKVDSIPPKTTKTYEGPFYESAEGYEFVDTITTVKLEATDGGDVCHVDGVKTYYRVINLKEEGWDYCKGMCDEWNPRHPGDWLTYKDPFTLAESCNIIEFYSEDALGNAENVDWQCVFSDHTEPITRKWFVGPQYPNDGDKDGTSHWIAPSTEIHLEATDPEPHPSGAKETYHRFTLVDDKYCRDQILCQGFDETITKEYDKASPKLMFNIPEESCHLIEYYSVDNVGKVEDVKRQCVFVDKTPPEVTKIISEPYEEWEGDDTFYPGLTDRCWSTDPAKTIECWKITLGTELKLSCNDPEPHPVDHSKMCFQIELDGESTPELMKKYCDKYGGAVEDEWCCKEIGIEEMTFHFLEESQHDLKIKCVDKLGNFDEELIDEEKFKVEGCTWKIPIKKKWNLISVPFTLLNDNPDVVFKDAMDDIAAVWTYDPENVACVNDWCLWIPGEDGTLEHIKPGYGYWILAKEDADIPIAGSLMSPGPFIEPPTRELQDNWNLIGYYGKGFYTTTEGECKLEDEPVYCALNSLVDTQQGFPRWSSLWNYFNHGLDDAGWIGLDACVQEVWNDNSFMEPGKGYWIEMDVPDGYAPATNCIWNEDMSCVMPILA